MKHGLSAYLSSSSCWFQELQIRFYCFPATKFLATGGCILLSFYP
ncbi:hypothetical protein SLEP1_g55524 [Rubroshorea leprosula]|uniref:Uncharacterized protein n=1 Tax=Rubroshorea leprosula TaxID=152421 RepID=A0AAV5MGR3_9ROSI|nr:hypothetical protein SLEP1_g55524 [Rubroshorea leprosula]